MLIHRPIERVVSSHPLPVVLFFLVLAGLSATLLPRITTDPSPYLLGEDHPARAKFVSLRDSYTGSADRVLVLLEAESTVFNKSTLARIKKLTAAFERIRILTEDDLSRFKSFATGLEGEAKQGLLSIIESGMDEDASFEMEGIIETLKQTGQWTPEAQEIFENTMIRLAPVQKVSSLATTDNILSIEGGLDINPIYEEVPESREALAEIGRRALENELFHDVLVTEDQRHTSIILELALNEDDSDGQLKIYKRVKEIVEKEIPGDERHFVAGFPVVAATVGESIDSDSKRLFPVVLTLIIACLLLLFRMVKGVMVPVLVVLFSLVMTLGLKVLFGIPLNVVTTALPVFVLSIGVADGIHIFSEYRDHLALGLAKREAVIKTMRELVSPVVMTSLTTAAAFWSLSVTEIVQLRHFGIFVAAGTLVAMVLSLIFIPALLLVLPQGKTRGKKQISRFDRRFQSGLEAISRFAIRRARLILVASALAAGIAVFGASHIKVDNNNVEFHPSDSEMVIATEKINETLAGSMDLNILVRGTGNEKEPIKDPGNLRAIDDLSRFLENKPMVGKVLSIASLIKRINLVLHDGDQVYNRIPDDVETVEYTKADEEDASRAGEKVTEKVSGREIVSQYVFLYENSGGEALSDVVDFEYKKANMRVVLTTNSSHETSRLIDEINEFVKVRFPGDLEIEVTGPAGILVEATREIVYGQITSLLLSMILIFAMLVYTFRSARKGLMAMIPLGAAILVNFGVMGFLDIPLDVGSSVVASIVIGIGVDYSIHYLSRLQASLRQGASFEEAVLVTVSFSGKAIVFNALVVGIGFIAMLFSVMTPLVTMGWMITMTMFISAFGTIVLLPAALKLVKLRG